MKKLFTSLLGVMMLVTPISTLTAFQEINKTVKPSKIIANPAEVIANKINGRKAIVLSYETTPSYCKNTKLEIFRILNFRNSKFTYQDFQHIIFPKTSLKDVSPAVFTIKVGKYVAKKSVFIGVNRLETISGDTSKPYQYAANVTAVAFSIRIDLNYFEYTYAHHNFKEQPFIQSFYYDGTNTFHPNMVKLIQDPALTSQAMTAFNDAVSSPFCISQYLAVPIGYAGITDIGLMMYNSQTKAFSAEVVEIHI